MQETARAYRLMQIAPKHEVGSGTVFPDVSEPGLDREPPTIEISMDKLKRELQEIARYQRIAQRLGQTASGSSHLSTGPAPIVRTFLDRTNIPNCELRIIFPLSNDHILTLVQYSVFRAVLANALYMGIDPTTICRHTTPPLDFEALDASNIPPTLQPTGVQKMIPHHPLLDLIPLRGFRENLFLTRNRYDRAALAADIFDIPKYSKAPGRNGLVVWGEPWDAAAWEVTEGFARKWGWALKGCAELLKSTDYWRVKRGEKPLKHVLQVPWNWSVV